MNALLNTLNTLRRTIRLTAEHAGIDTSWRPDRYEWLLAQLAKISTSPRERIREMETELEQMRVQLAGVLVAAEGGTHDPAKQGDYGWSLPYQRVLELQRELAAARETIRVLREQIAVAYEQLTQSEKGSPFMRELTDAELTDAWNEFEFDPEQYWLSLPGGYREQLTRFVTRCIALATRLPKGAETATYRLESAATVGIEMVDGTLRLRFDPDAETEETP